MAANAQHPPQLHISHLCDNRRCFNPDHLTAERAIVNNSRKGCPGPITCSVHGHLIVDLCPHTPRCIRPPRDDVNCCLAIKESESGWNSQVSEEFTASQSTSVAAELERQESVEFEGAEFLEEAVRQGLL